MNQWINESINQSIILRDKSESPKRVYYPFLQFGTQTCVYIDNLKMSRCLRVSKKHSGQRVQITKNQQ